MVKLYVIENKKITEVDKIPTRFKKQIVTKGEKRNNHLIEKYYPYLV